jgi:tRNA A-37 threonylcarbamoyl transferase component Bud32
MSAAVPPGSPEHARLEEVLADYMHRLDRGEAVDREQLLASHPEFAEELRSYFDAADEIDGLRGAGTSFLPSHVQPQPIWVDDTPPPRRRVRYLGDYELLQEIAQGGMGVIYRARQLSLGRLVALKMIRAGALASAADVRRFYAEAEAAAHLDHPNIVPIYEVGEHEGQHYYSMKLVEGGSLRQYLPRLQGDARATAQLLATVARAVHYAHQRGILHRDLKPGNILLVGPDPATPDDGALVPLVTDFGLAKKIGGEATLTQPGLIVGTPTYMAPEQASGQPLTVAADVYALGTILYECLAGQPPFQAETPVATLAQLVSEEPRPPRALNPRVDRDLETICLKCLQKHPPGRYATAEALADDLERWLRGEPILARPVGAVGRAVRWARRRPAVAALVAALVLASSGGAAGVGWQWRRAEANAAAREREAEKERRTAYQRTIALAHAEWQRRPGSLPVRRRRSDAARLGVAVPGPALRRPSPADTPRPHRRGHRRRPGGSGRLGRQRRRGRDGAPVAPQRRPPWPGPSRARRAGQRRRLQPGRRACRQRRAGPHPAPLGRGHGRTAARLSRARPSDHGSGLPPRRPAPRRGRRGAHPRRHHARRRGPGVGAGHRSRALQGGG